MNKELMDKIVDFLGQDDEDYILDECKKGGFLQAYPRDMFKPDVYYKYGATMYVFNLAGGNKLKVETYKIYQGNPNGYPIGKPFWI